MKFSSLISNIKTIALACSLGYIVFLRECSTTQIPKDKVLVDKYLYDSAMAVVPDTIVNIDTIYQTDWITLIDTVKIYPVEKNDTILHYTDSLVTDDLELAFSADLSTLNYSLVPNYSYKLKVPRIIEKVVNKPYPTIIKEPVIPKREFGIEVGVGGNKNIFVPSVEFNLTTKQNKLYGFEVSLYGDSPVYQFKIGKKW